MKHMFPVGVCTFLYDLAIHVHRMEDCRLPGQPLKYHPKGRRRPGRQLKRLLDDVNAKIVRGHPALNS
jgi:hypothetical protein